MPVSTVTTSTHVTVSVPPAPALTPLMFGGVVMRPEATAYDQAMARWKDKFAVDLSAFAAAVSAQLANIINTSGGQSASLTAILAAIAQLNLQVFQINSALTALTVNVNTILANAAPLIHISGVGVTPNSPLITPTTSTLATPWCVNDDDGNYWLWGGPVKKWLS